MAEASGIGYINGFIERKTSGRYEGCLRVDGVDLSPIEGVYFMRQGIQYLWLKRKPLLEYDFNKEKFFQRESEPGWEAYLQKHPSSTASYKGECVLLKFRYSIVGFWDDVLGKDKHRLNLIVERLPMSQQTIINAINKRNKQQKKE